MLLAHNRNVWNSKTGNAQVRTVIRATCKFLTLIDYTSALEKRAVSWASAIGNGFFRKMPNLGGVKLLFTHVDWLFR